MLPIRHKSIFKSRWIALLWAGGILWGAIEFAGGRGSADSSDNADVAAVQAMSNALGAP
jgi:hypothetical protein